MKKLLSVMFFVAMLFSPLLPLHSVGVAAASNTNAVNVLKTPNGPCSSNLDKNGTPSICGDDSTNGANPLFGSTGIVTVIVRIISIVIGFLAIVFLIVQAIKFAGSGGDPQAVASARSGILYALIGLIVAVLAQVLVDFVLTKIT